MKPIPKTIKFSVIIPIYKVEKYLNQCIDSVLLQNYHNIEIILVDDGSPDNCPTICDEFAVRDNRINVIHKENGGLSDARNTGLLIATGDYVIFLDSDDYWEGDDNLSNLANVIEKHKNLDIVLFRRSYLYEGERLIKPQKVFKYRTSKNLNRDEIFSSLIRNSEFECSACLKVIRRELLIKNNLYFRKGIKSEDIEWYLRVFPFIKTIETINEPFYIYRTQRVGSITSTIGLNNIIDLTQTIKERYIYIKKEECNFSKLFVKCYNSYLAYQLTIIIGYYSFLDYEERNDIKKKIKELIPILRFDLYKKTKYINYMFRFLGLSFTSSILAHYIKLRKKGKISL